MLKTASWIKENCLFALQEYSPDDLYATAQTVQTPPPIEQPKPIINDKVTVSLPPQKKPMPDPKPGDIWMAKPPSEWKAAIEGRPAAWTGFSGDNDYPRPCYIKDAAGSKVAAVPISTAFYHTKPGDVKLVPSDPDFRLTGLDKPSLVKRASMTVLNKEDLYKKIGILPIRTRVNMGI